LSAEDIKHCVLLLSDSSVWCVPSW